MAISTVGNYPGTWPQPGAYAPAAPSAPSAPAFPVDTYRPAPMTGQATGQAGGLNVGRMASWGLGALGAVRYVLPHLGSPAGWIKLAVVAAGALAGNFVWNKLEKDVTNGTAGSVGHVGTMAGGAVGGFLLGRAILGDNPAGWLTGLVIGGGAWAGHKIYAMMAK